MFKSNKHVNEKIDLYIYGAGGFGREFLAQFNVHNEYKKRFKFISFVDDDLFIRENCFSLEEVKKVAAQKIVAIVVCIADPAIRKRKVIELKKENNIIFPSFVFGKHFSTIRNDCGIICCENSIVNVDCKLEEFVMLCQGVVVGHDSKVGSFSTLYPCSFVAGNSVIDKNVQCGANSTIVQGIRVCSDCFIGAGAVVTKNITLPGIYIGVPARRKNAS